MLRTILAGALASAALLAGGGAHAQAYGYGGYEGGYGPGVSVGAGVGGSYGYGGYAPYRPRGFTLAGVRAGVTVLGLDIDGSAEVTIGSHDRGPGYAPAPYAPSAPPETGYGPVSPPPGYWMGYSAELPYVASYGCGCAAHPPPCCGYGGY